MDFSLHCRTCFEYKDIEFSVNITRKCNWNNSAKDIIIKLVPQMAETLLDTEFICEDCFNVLESCAIFMDKCLKTEEKLKTHKQMECNDTDNVEALQEADGEIENDSCPLKGDFPEDYLVINGDTQKNYAVEEHNYSVNDTHTDISTLPDEIDKHNRIITLERSNNVITQGFINTLEQSGVNILEVSSNPDATSSNTKKRILLLGSHIFNTAYKCPKCPKYLQSKKKYNNHVLNCNKKPQNKDDEELIKCQICARSMKRKRMELHLIRHRERDEERQLIKKRRENEKRTLQCRTCCERFTSKEDYEIHLQLHPPFICDKCGKGFAQSASLNSHRMTHNDPNSCICEICGKCYKTTNMLRVHLQNHENKKYKCHLCAKVFKVKGRVLRHIKNVHNSEYSVQCTQCGKLFKSRASHNAHVRLVHLKMKPYNCKICGKKFGRTDYLQRHEARHTGAPNTKSSNLLKGNRICIKRYNDNKEPVSLPCKFCGKWFLGIPKLKLHLETHVKICRFPCQFCPLTFARKHICKKHELLHKGLENFFRCNICWRRLTSKEDLDEHVRTKHKNPKYACTTCGKRFHREYLMNHHQLLEHRTPEDTEKAKQIVYESLLELAAPKSEVITTPEDTEEAKQIVYENLLEFDAPKDEDETLTSPEDTEDAKQIVYESLLESKDEII